MIHSQTEATEQTRRNSLLVDSEAICAEYFGLRGSQPLSELADLRIAEMSDLRLLDVADPSSNM